MQPAIALEQSSVVNAPASHGAWRTSEEALVSIILTMGSAGNGRQGFSEAVDATGINAKDFLTTELKTIWHIMGLLYQRGDEIDIMTLWAETQKSDKATKVIDENMLKYLLMSNSYSGHRTHAENIVDASVSNSLNMALNKLQPLLHNPKITAKEKQRRLHQIVVDLSERTERVAQSQTIDMSQGMELFIDDYLSQSDEAEKETIGIPTGFPQLDTATDGWKKSTLNIIAGPPGSGKTVFLGTSALHAVMNGKRVLMVQLELPLEQSYRRILCAFAGIDSNRLKHRNLKSWEQSRLAQASQMLKEFDKEGRFTLLTMNQPTLEDIKIKLDTLMIKGYDVIFFDYAGGAKIARSNTRMDDLEHHRLIYNAIDSWKKNYNIPIVAGVQYGHPRPQKHPGAYTMDMIYSSSYIKHNADTIMFLHPDKKSDEDSKSKDSASFVVVKNRDGQKSYGSNTIIKTSAEMNMFRFIPSGAQYLGSTPPPLWVIHKQNQPRTADELKDL